MTAIYCAFRQYRENNCWALIAWSKWPKEAFSGHAGASSIDPFCQENLYIVESDNIRRLSGIHSSASAAYVLIEPWIVLQGHLPAFIGLRDIAASSFDRDQNKKGFRIESQHHQLQLGTVQPQACKKENLLEKVHWATNNWILGVWDRRNYLQKGGDILKKRQRRDRREPAFTSLSRESRDERIDYGFLFL